MPTILTACDDCGLRADKARWVPIDKYTDKDAKAKRLCLGDLATRRIAGESWTRELWRGR